MPFVERPSQKVSWVSDNDPAKIVEPSAGKKLTGWVSGEKPAFQTFNWILNAFSQWNDWISGIPVYWGDEAVCFGEYAGGVGAFTNSQSSISSGEGNVMIGPYSGMRNTPVQMQYVTAIGNQAGRSSSANSFSTYLGANSGFGSNIGFGSTIVGARVMQNLNVNGNVIAALGVATNEAPYYELLFYGDFTSRNSSWNLPITFLEAVTFDAEVYFSNQIGITGDGSFSFGDHYDITASVKNNQRRLAVTYDGVIKACFYHYDYASWQYKDTFVVLNNFRVASSVDGSMDPADGYTVAFSVDAVDGLSSSLSATWHGVHDFYDDINVRDRIVFLNNPTPYESFYGVASSYLSSVDSYAQFVTGFGFNDTTIDGNYVIRANGLYFVEQGEEMAINSGRMYYRGGYWFFIATAFRSCTDSFEVWHTNRMDKILSVNDDAFMYYTYNGAGTWYLRLNVTADKFEYRGPEVQFYYSELAGYIFHVSYAQKGGRFFATAYIGRLWTTSTDTVDSMSVARYGLHTPGTDGRIRAALWQEASGNVTLNCSDYAGFTRIAVGGIVAAFFTSDYCVLGSEVSGVRRRSVFIAGGLMKGFADLEQSDMMLAQYRGIVNLSIWVPQYNIDVSAATWWITDISHPSGVNIYNGMEIELVLGSRIRGATVQIGSTSAYGGSVRAFNKDVGGGFVSVVTPAVVKMKRIDDVWVAFPVIHASDF